MAHSKYQNNEWNSHCFIQRHAPIEGKNVWHLEIVMINWFMLECPALPILLLYDSSHERNLHGLGPQGQTNQIILPEQSWL